MRGTYIKIITCIALGTIFLLQGIWLYNTYKLRDKEVKNMLEDIYVSSIKKEFFFRLTNFQPQLPYGSSVKVTRDEFRDALLFNDLLSTFDVSFSLESFDSIWCRELLDNDIAAIKYSFFVTDSTNNILQQINRGVKKNTHLSIDLKKPIRTDYSEYIQAIIESPHKIVLERMVLLLMASLVIGIIIGYCFYLQIRVIARQNRIAKARQDFTYTMVRDMKNPITTILTSANDLKEGKFDDKAELKKEYFEIIQKEGNHLLSLANKALTIAKFEEDKIALAKSNISVKELFGNLINKYQPTATKKVEFITELNDIPTIYADPEYMNEAFDILIDNAIKYSKENVTIRIICHKEKSNILISIEDNGIGISTNDQKRIGLGLSYVYQIVKVHGGNMKIESAPDQYSKFTIRIPHKEYD